MNRLMRAAATSHALSLAAMEEASRTGDRVAEVEHLLLALTVTEQPAGQVLRGLGATLEATRAAVASQHAAQLASIGIDGAGLERSRPGRIVFHETGGYSWGERPLAVITRAGDLPSRGDAAAVLRELVVEPSGMVEAVLGRLGIAPHAVVSRLDEIDQVAAAAARATGTRDGEDSHVEPRRDAAHEPRARAPRRGLSAATRAFVPAPPDRVWAFLVDPSRLPDWDPGIEACAAAHPATGLGGVWDAQATTARPDGRELRVRPEHLRRRFEVAVLDAERAIEWRMSFPDAPSANTRRVRIELAPAAGGSQLELELEWERPEGSRPHPLLRWAMRPITRLAVRMQVSQLGSGIARAFR